MTRLSTRCTKSIVGIKQFLPSKWRPERLRRQEKLLNLQAYVDVLLERDDLISARNRCVCYIIEFPGDRSGYQVLGRVFECAGDSSAAAQCFNARIPESKQNELFGAELNYTITDHSFVHSIAGHPAERCPVVALWPEQSMALQQFQRAELCARATQTLFVENGSIWHDGYNTVPFDVDGQPIMAAVIGNIGPVVSNVSQRRPKRVQGDVVLLGARGTNNYYHWMTDILPKLAVLKQCGFEWDKTTRFVFRNVSKLFQIRTLELLGISRSQCLQTCNGNEYIYARRIIIPQLDNRMCLTMGSWVPEFLKREFMPSESSAKGQRKIYISRDPSTAQGRDVENADQVNAFFLSHGYDIVYPERYSIVEQAQLFSSASHIAAPHGAGLTNLHFCSPGTRVYEFHGAHFSPCYWALCEKLEITYRNFDCASTEGLDVTRLDAAKTLDARRGQEFSIPVELLDSVI